MGRNLKTAALGHRRQVSEYVNSRAQTNAAFRTKTVNIRNHQTPGIINITELDGAEPPKPRTAASTNDHLHSFATTAKNPQLHSPPQQPARSRAESSQRTRCGSSQEEQQKPLRQLNLHEKPNLLFRKQSNIRSQKRNRNPK